MLLTPSKIASLPVGRYRDANGPSGLHLEKREDGASWTLRFAIAGREHWLGLGAARNVSLAQARELAREAHYKIRQGINPVQERREARLAQKIETAKPKMLTFRQVAESLFNLHADGWSKKHRRNWLQPLATYVYPRLGAVPINGITAAVQIRDLLAPLLDRPSVFNRCRQRIEAVLDHGAALGLRSGDNAAKLVASLVKVHHETTHSPSMPYHQVPAFMERLDAEPYVASKALQIKILIAERRAALDAQLTERALQLADIDFQVNQIDSAVGEAAKRGRTNGAMDLAQSQRRNRVDLVKQRGVISTRLPS